MYSAHASTFNSLALEDAHIKEAAEVAAHYHVDVNQGLSEQEVLQARTKYGRNELEPEQSTPLWKLVLKQFDDLLVKILLVAAVVDFIIAMTEGQSIASGLVEPMVILVILIANATVGVVTERSAEQAIEELKAYEAESATVVREGQTRQVPARDVVPGDVLEVTVGCKVPADMRVTSIYTSMLKVDQSLLTGESVAVEKHIEVVTLGTKAVVQDKTNILFSGTLVVAGRARGIVVGTGSSTAMGKIGDAMKDAPEVVTPLKAKLDEFGELLSKIIAAICVLVWIVNINRFKDPALGGWLSGAIHYFKIAVALAVAAIPEGLPAVVTTCLALGTRRMAQRNAIVRTLPSVETLGCTTVICTDKTGTLTTNQMTVVKVVVLHASNGQLTEYDVTGTSFSKQGSILAPGGVALRQPADSPGLLHTAMGSALCNDSHVQWNPKQVEQSRDIVGDVIAGGVQRIGDPTEVALRVLAEKVGLPSSIVTPFSPSPFEQPMGMGGSAAVYDMPGGQHDLSCNSYWQSQYNRRSLLEFSRDRKMMTVLVDGNGRTQLWTKGAPEAVLAACSTALANNGEGVVPLDQASRQALLQNLQVLGGGQALRCLALAVKQMPAHADTVSAADESGLTFVAMVGMHDPPRLECRSAIETCRAAGIRVVMVSGDNKATAEAVARQVGALTDPATASKWSSSHDAQAMASLTGVEFESLAGLAQSQAASSLQVFSRVEPLHKLRLVELLQAQGQVVAMTGDGVNDAPALMRSDIGVAMGSGTAVAKSASDMVLADDNFATIVFAVAEGRAIFNNTKQFIRYMISSNIGEVVAIFAAAMLGMPEVLTPVQLLWVNLVTDGLPATALGLNKPEKDLMLQAPRRMNKPLVNRWLLIRYVIIGTYVGAVTVVGFIWWFINYERGGNISWSKLTHFQKCEQWEGGHKNCEVFLSKHPRTISMSVLVVVEMFNALNNLSEDASLLRVPPWDNMWLIAAIATSMILHFFILYFPPAAAVFGVAPLDWTEWKVVVLLSAPVILVDEVLKAVSRRRKSASSSRGLQSLGLAAIAVDKSVDIGSGNASKQL